MILCAVIAGANSISGIHQYVQCKSIMFQNLLGIDKPPCYMVFWWLLTRLNPESLQASFIKWLNLISVDVKSKVIAIDGKHLNGLIGGNKVHLVAAWESTRGLLLGQVSRRKIE